MDLRFITKSIHAYLDYPVATALMSAPFVLGIGASNACAFWLSLGTGVAALILTLLTNHKLGLIRVLPYSFHLAVDGVVGLTFLFATIAFGFTGLDTWFFLINGVAVLTVVSLHEPEKQMPHFQPNATANAILQ